jgi:hypothetical protein
MRKALSFDTVPEAEFAGGLLHAVGIPCEVRPAGISSTGELGVPLRFFPEVWVQRDEELPAALHILERHRDAHAPGWSCPNCKSENEAPFDACWSCGTDRP